jgi:hypothetical protein
LCSIEIEPLAGKVAQGQIDRGSTAGSKPTRRVIPRKQAEAAAALATSHTWKMLNEIKDQGDWAEVLWQHADAVNGGEGVMTGGGSQPPTRAEAEGALAVVSPAR